LSNSQIVRHGVTHGLRHDWLNVTANRNAASVSLLACRTEICVDVTIGVKRLTDYWTPEKLAAVLAKAIESGD